MTTNNVVRELKLHSPAGVEPAVFTWPNVDQEVDDRTDCFSLFIFFYLDD